MSLGAMNLAEQFKQTGYVEICYTEHGAAIFDALYAQIDELITFLQENPVWAQKLYSVQIGGFAFGVSVGYAF